MSRPLTPKSSMETLKKEAKRWLKALRSGDAEARRGRARRPSAPTRPGLRDVQHALAREHGMASWTALKEKLSDHELARRSHEERVSEFLEHAILTYGIPPGTEDWSPSYADDVGRRQRAARILRQHPEVGRDSIHTAVLWGCRRGRTSLSDCPTLAKGGIGAATIAIHAGRLRHAASDTRS
jgi:hypothetical protein